MTHRVLYIDHKQEDMPKDYSYSVKAVSTAPEHFIHHRKHGRMRLQIVLALTGVITYGFSLSSFSQWLQYSRQPDDVVSKELPTATPRVRNEASNQTRASMPVLPYNRSSDRMQSAMSKIEKNTTLVSPPLSKGISSSQVVEAPVFLFDSENETTGNSECKITNTSLAEMKFLGSGFVGQMFLADMDCAKGKEKRKVALKFLAERLNNTDKWLPFYGQIGKYISINKRQIQAHINVYQRLTSNISTHPTSVEGSTGNHTNEKEKVLQHFAIRMGSVRFPRSMMQTVMAVANQSLSSKTAYRSIVFSPNATENDDGSMEGYIYPFQSGKPMKDLVIDDHFKNEGRHHQAIRDVVYIYMHMYRQGVMHCDMKLEHLIYSPDTNVTAMIDFDAFRRFPPPEERSDGQRQHFQWQQLQLFSVIASICDYKVQKEQEKHNPLLKVKQNACAKSGAPDGLDLAQTYSSIFEKCGFDRELIWRNGMLNNTEETYHALTEWSSATVAAAPAIFFDSEHDSSSNTECMITNSSLAKMKFLGSGFNGQVFVVDMDCAQGKGERKTALKFITQRLNMTVKKFTYGLIGKYRSDSKKEQQKHTDLYRHLTSNLTTYQTSNNGSTGSSKNEKEKVLQHFAIRMGSVRFPPFMLRTVMAVANRSLSSKKAFRGMVLDPNITEEDDGSVEGYLYPFQAGRSMQQLAGDARFKREGRHHQMIRDAVYIYWHMYRKGIMHCDMKLEHLIYSPDTNVTAMIDFDSFRQYPPPEKRSDRQRRSFQWHQWQLFSVIANVCDFNAQKQLEKGNPTMQVSHQPCNNVVPYDGLDPAQLYASIFEKCGFDRKLIWRNDMLDNTEETYRALAEWSGL